MASTKRFPFGKTPEGHTQSYRSTAKAIGSAAVLVLTLTSSFLTLQAASQQDPNSADAKRVGKQTANKSSKPRPAKLSAHTSRNQQAPKPVNAAEPHAVLNGPAASDVAALTELLTRQQEQLAAQQAENGGVEWTLEFPS